ncbi:ABC transporter permease subunit [Bordetella trematum]|uniref:ABC transporter permease subunit n=1 Tax=Bordetella trematum TaxID=123899 RepID=UPI00046ED521|nr:ABC transporter permease subunit [Bordetella trematum]
MMRLLVGKELLALRREPRLWVLGLGLALLLALALFAAAQQQQRQEQERQAIGEDVRAQWDRQGIKHPHRGAHFGMYVFRPREPLAAFDPGIVPYVGQAIWLEPHRRNLARHEPAADNGPVQRLANVSPAFLLNALLPLLILALAFNQVTREREQGTLRLLQSQGVSRLAWLVSKLIAVALGLAALLLPLLGGAAVAAYAAGGLSLLIQTLWLEAAYLLYYVVIAGLGLALGACCRGSRAALCLLIALWAAWVFAVPRLAAAAAQRLVPLPAADQFWAAIARDYRQGLPGDPDLATQVAGFEAALLRRYGVQRLEDVPLGVNAARRLMRDAYADRVHAHHFDELWRRYEQQQQVLRGFAGFSPVLTMQLLSSALSATSLSSQQHFEAMAEDYRRSFNRRIDEWDRDHTQGLVSYEQAYGANTLWQSMPVFEAAGPPPAQVLRQARPEMTLLAIWAALMIGCLTWAARRV